MSAAIKPATPLPFGFEYHANGALTCLETNQVNGAPTGAMAVGSLSTDHAAYIVTACNAYPELVAALQRACIIVSSEAKGEVDRGISPADGYACGMEHSIRALLAKLGAA